MVDVKGHAIVLPGGGLEGRDISKYQIIAKGDYERRTVVFQQGVADFRDDYRPVAYFSGNCNGIGLEPKRSGSLYFFAEHHPDRPNPSTAPPIKVIATYRGMKIAEMIKLFDDETLLDSWYAGNRNLCFAGVGPSPRYPQSVEKIEELTGKNARESILTVVPDNIDEILKKSDTYWFDGAEIAEEVELGTLKETQAVRSFLDDYYNFQRYYHKPVDVLEIITNIAEGVQRPKVSPKGHS